ncbi:GIY-YIG nuclease family protein [Paraburkholderia sp. T12-10]|nr:GIY-YIG nuclease family protein [Paraburkholderia sp. T12-10]
MSLLSVEEIEALSKPFPRHAVIYFLFKEDRIVYVGQSTNVHLRIGSHASGAYRKEFDAFSMIDVPDGIDPTELEFSYIEQFAPIYNFKGLKGKSWKDDLSISRAAIHRAMERVDDGQSTEEAAKAERISPSILRRYLSWRKGDEKNQLLLPRADVGSTEAVI